MRPSIFLEIGHRKHLHSTAWLDGLRGVAAFFVVFAHAGNVFYPWHRHGWSSENPHFFELPIVRLFYSGASMVSIFFVISGYAVSFKPLLLVGKNETSKVFDSLASSTFRRGIRLFMPCAVIAFLCAWVDHFGIYDPGWQNQDHREDSVPDTFRWWFNAVVLGIDPFRTNHKRPWDTPLSSVEQTMWTIPLEYRGSMVVFALILILAKTRRSIRLGSLGGYLLWLVYVGQWDIFLFVSGMLCCEIHHMSQSRTTTNLLDPSDASIGPRQLRSFIDFGLAMRYIGLMVIVYVLSQPEDYLGRGDAPFYATLDTWRPASWSDNPDAGRFWQCLAGVGLVLLVDHTAMFRRVLMTRFPQYLGRISFSMYLLHAMFLKIAGPGLKAGVFRWLGFIINAWWIMEGLGMIIIAAIFLPILFWASDVTTRYVDQGSVDLARWLEGKFYEEERKEMTTPLPSPELEKARTAGYHCA